MVVIWGLNFVVMKTGLGPVADDAGALRFALAAFPLILFVRPPALPWRWIAAYGLAQGLGQFGLLFVALQAGMPAGMASLVIQTQAFFTLLLAAAAARTRAPASLDRGVAALGLAVIALGRGDGPGQMTMIGFVLMGAAFMWAVSNIIVRLASNRAPGYAPSRSSPGAAWRRCCPSCCWRC